MYFKHVMIGFFILGLFSWFYGDHILYYQAKLMIQWQYDRPAYEAYEKIVTFYPESRYYKEVREKMKTLRIGNRDLDKVIQKKEQEMERRNKEKEAIESFR